MTVKKITVIGTGVIGASWVAFFLSKGFKVVANDTGPNAEQKLHEFLKDAWPELEHVGLAPGASLDNLSFSADLNEALKDTDFVQENGPERIDFKRDLYKRIDAATPKEVLIATSSSGLKMSDVQRDCAKFPERCVVGHPFNPPHLIPLVEVVGGQKTSKENLDKAQAFYDGLGKKSIRLNKELPGHVANRIALALFKEVCWLVDNDVVSVTDADRAVSWGPGLRWGLLGQIMLYNLGGGAGGMEHFLEQFQGPVNAAWKILGDVTLTPELEKKISDGVIQEMSGETLAQIAKDRDKALVDLIKVRQSLSKVFSQ